MSVIDEEAVSLAHRREQIRARLARDFHVTALLVPVKTVAAVVGLSATTIYSYIRNGVFFMPYRRVHNTPMVDVEDLVDWLMRDETTNQPSVHETLRPDAALVRRKTVSTVDPVAEAVAETLSQMSLKSRRR
jgi:TATA-binding protein-associated factor Taf7